MPLCPFTSGNYIDFCIGREWATPDRQQNANGDVRVIMARITGDTAPRDYQTAYYPVRKDYAWHPETIVSPAVERHFDDIGPMPGLVWAYQIKPSGYTAEVSLSMHDLRTLGIRTSNPSDLMSPSVLLTMRVPFGAPPPTGPVSRSRWSSPGSAALLPAAWGTLVFEKSVRK